MQVIEQYGRFPHRNEIHKRATTPLEATFLEDPAFRFDLPLVYGEDGSAKFVQTDDFDCVSHATHPILLILSFLNK